LDPLGGLRAGLGPPFFRQQLRSFHQNSSSSQLDSGILQQFFLSFHLEPLSQVGWSPASSQGCFGTQNLRSGINSRGSLNGIRVRTFGPCANNSSWGRIGPFCGDVERAFRHSEKKMNVPGSARRVAPVLHTAVLLGIPEVIVAARVAVASFQSGLDMSRGGNSDGERSAQSNCS